LRIVDGIAAMTSSVRKRFGKVLGLVNIAGIGTHGAAASKFERLVASTLPQTTLREPRTRSSSMRMIWSKFVVSLLMEASSSVGSFASHDQPNPELREETLNAMLEAEAEQLCNAGCYERTDTRAPTDRHRESFCASPHGLFVRQRHGR